MRSRRVHARLLMKGMTMVKRTALMIAIVGVGIMVFAVEARPKDGSKASAGAAALTSMDYIEIQQLVRKYGWALDSGDNYGYAYADLYTPDGIFVGTNQGPNGRSYQGRDVLAALARGGPRGELYLSHLGMNHVITPTAGGGATGRAYVVILDVGLVGRPNGVSHGGHYDDVYMKTPVGWRFKKRTYYESKVDVRPQQAQPGR
jgi:SnoaL-like protein